MMTLLPPSLAADPGRAKAPHPLTLARDAHGCLRAAVEARVNRRVRDLRVESVGGRVTLHGRTDSYHVKQLAQHAVLAAGRTLLANHIQVRSPAGSTSGRPVVRFSRGPSPVERN